MSPRPAFRHPSLSIPAAVACRRLWAVVLAAVAVVAPGASDAWAQQTINGSLIKVIVSDTLAPEILAKASTAQGAGDPYVGQYCCNGPTWGTVIWLNGGSAKFSSPYQGQTGFTPVSNTLQAVTGGSQIVTVVDLGATGLRLTQVFTYIEGTRYVTKDWTLTNTGGSSYTDLRLFHGGDTFFGGVDSAYGFYDAANSMVYVRNNDYTNWGLMGFYANPGTPASHYFQGHYGTGNSYAKDTGSLPDSVVSSYTDSGYYLQWNRATLAPGQSWSIQAFETWTPAGGVQVLAPANQNTTADTTVTLPFTVQNLTASGATYSLTATSGAGWTTTLPGGANVTVPANSSSTVNVQVVVPPGASGSSTVTLATGGGGVASASNTLTVVNLSLGLSPSSVNFGTVAVGSAAAAQAVTVTNNSSGAVTLGTATATSPFGKSSDTCSGAVLAIGATCTVSATLATGSAGTFNASLNLPVLEPLLITRTVALSAVVSDVVLPATPAFSSSTTWVNNQTRTGLVATPASGNDAAVTHFKITTVTGGTLFQADGTTVLAAGDFITKAEGAAGLKFTPTANSFTNGVVGVRASSSASDDGLGGSEAQATVVVQAVPVLGNPTTTATYVEDDAVGVAVFPAAEVLYNGGLFSGAKVTISTGFVSGQDVLTFTNSGGITGAWNGTSGVLTITGSASDAAYTTFLRSIRYVNGNTTNPTLGGRTISASLGTTSLYYDSTGHYYEFVSVAGLAWGTSRTRAGATGSYGTAGYPTGMFGLQGYLATITSADENAFLTQKVAGSAWIGATDVSVDGQWRWVTGPEGLESSGNGRLFCVGNNPCTAQSGYYVNWNGGEPNGAAHSEDYAHMMSWTTPAGMWNDLPDAGGGGQYASTGYVVEYGGMPGDPNLTLQTSVTMTVQGANDAPTITQGATAAVTMSEDGAPTAFALTLNATDPEFDTLTWSVSTAAAHGTATASGTGLSKAIAYTPVADYAGADSFVVRVTDGVLTDTIQVNVTVSAVNDAPIITDGTSVAVTLDENGAPTAFTLTLSASDVDADTLTWSIASQGAHGTASASGTGLSKAIGYTPAIDYEGTDSFVVRVSDGTLTDTITVQVTMRPRPNTPVVSNATAYVNNMSASGLVVTPTSGDTGTSHFRIASIVGGTLFKHDGTTPLVVDDFITLAEGAAGLRFLPDTDAFSDGSVGVQASADATSAGLAGQVATGTVDVLAVPILRNTEGTRTFVEDGAPAVVFPDVTVLYGGATLSQAKVSIGAGFVAGQDQLQFANAGPITGAWNSTSGVLTLTGEATDAQYQAALRSITYRNTNLLNPATTPRAVSITLANGALYSGDTNHYYEFVAAAGIYWTASRARAENVAQYGQPGYPRGMFGLRGYLTTITSAAENAFLAQKVSGTSWIGASDALQENTWRWVTGPEGLEDAGNGRIFCIGVITCVAQNGHYANWNTREPNQSGNEDYAHMMSWSAPVGRWNDLPDQSGGGSYRSTGYLVEYGGLPGDPVVTLQGEATVVVQASNDGPAANANAYAVAEDGVLTTTPPGVLGNDSDPEGDSLTARLVSDVAHGTLALAANGSFTYAPARDYAGPDAFTYIVSDGVFESLPATVSITVTAVNDAPTARADAFAIAEDAPLDVAAPGVLANDSDIERTPLLAILVSSPAHGTVQLSASGAFVYQPAPEYSGVDSFSYKPSDGSATGTAVLVSITVSRVDDAPVSGDDRYGTREDTALIVPAPGLLGNDRDPDSPVLTAIQVMGARHGGVTINPDGSFGYMPDPDWSGIDEFIYAPFDGTTRGAEVTVHVVVGSENDVPAGRADTFATDEDTVLLATAGVLANDVDPDSPLTAVLVTPPAHGTLALNPDGTFTYTPDADWNGTDTFIYEPRDDLQAGSSVVATVVVAAVNDTPVAVADTVAATEDTPLQVAAPGVLDNDVDADGDPLLAILTEGASHGTVQLKYDGSFVYTPSPDYSGPDTFSYKPNDATRSGEPVVVAISVAAVNDAPETLDDVFGITEDTLLTVAAPGVLRNDVDVDSPTLVASLVSTTSHGTLTFNADGSFTYMPDQYWNGTDVFTYRTSDGENTSALMTVEVVVDPVNNPPTGDSDGYVTAEDTPLVVAAPGVLLNDRDVDGDALTAVLVRAPSHGTLDLVGGGFTYTPAANYSGRDRFVYAPSDGVVTASPVIVNLLVTPVDDPPTGHEERFTTEQNVPLKQPVSGVLDNDLDPESRAMIAVLDREPSHGTIVFNDDGSFTYTPDRGFAGEDDFAYRPLAGSQAGDPVTVIIDVVSTEVGRVLAEGMVGNGFDTWVTMVNTADHPATVRVDYLLAAGATIAAAVDVPAHRRVTLHPADAGVTGPFSTHVVAPASVAVSRSMTFGTAAPGASLEGAQLPSSSWFFAEGATHGFDLFYLLVNQGSEDVVVDGTYLLPAGGPVTRSYTVPARGRATIWANTEDPALVATAVAARFIARTGAIVAERSMYLKTADGQWKGGHTGAGLPAPGIDRVFAEGSTAGTMETYLLLANPSPSEAVVRVTYVREAGAPVAVSHVVPPWSRIDAVMSLDAPELGQVSAGILVHSTNGVPVVAERVTWWAAAGGGWSDGHVSAGSAEASTSWASADGVEAGPARADTYLLVVNPGEVDTTVRVTILPEDGGATVSRDLAVPAMRRATAVLHELFPETVGTRFGFVVESLDGWAAPVVVETSLYWTGPMGGWACGMSATAAPLAWLR
ncbi:MAG: tandem-95 repeat protein [Acidobacteria bacterium]|nr:tandem-95 repeat protein [Acidobacteriota bacterium]